MKKTLTLLSLLFLLITTMGCMRAVDEGNFTEAPIEFLDIYYMNDLHGRLLYDTPSMGASYFGNFLKYQKNINPNNTIILGGGDMLQGGVLSNYYHGKSTLEIMNEIGFDTWVIGNHEFDWGLETVTQYFIPGDNQVANHPLLGANVFYDGTTDIPEGIDPYTIITRGSLKIGVIGTMGESLKSSIAAHLVSDYTFADPVPIVKDLTRYLREEEKVDIVILISHDTGETLNLSLANADENERVDAIFNAHNHRVETTTINGVPVMQAGGNGSHIAHLHFKIENSRITSFEQTTLNRSTNQLLREKDPAIEAMMQSYLLETNHLFEVITTSDADYSQNDLGHFIARVMRKATSVDIAFQNSGGTRATLSTNDAISYATLYDIFPFDNEVITVLLKGETIKHYISQLSTPIYSTDVNYFEDDTYYSVATNDFLFYHESDFHPFNKGLDQTLTGYQMRDLAYIELIAQQGIYSRFNLNNALLITEDLVETTP